MTADGRRQHWPTMEEDWDAIDRVAAGRDGYGVGAGWLALDQGVTRSRGLGRRLERLARGVGVNDGP